MENKIHIKNEYKYNVQINVEDYGKCFCGGVLEKDKESHKEYMTGESNNYICRKCGAVIIFYTEIAVERYGKL